SELTIRSQIGISSAFLSLSYPEVASGLPAQIATKRVVKSGPVFVDTQGGWLRKSNMQRRSFDRILAKASLPDTTRFHDLRHSCATLLLLSGENIKVVSERLGHASIQITLDIYSHVLPGMQDGAVDQMTGILGGTGEIGHTMGTQRPKNASDGSA